MLVDLGRNDLGRVCRPGTVEVPEFATIERYSHVMHIVSTVVGELRDDRTAFDALAATFPAGTLSGAPKVRAMEIIDELEPTRRGLYGGTVGYFGFGGDLDMAIAIRTALLRDGVAYVQAGGGHRRRLRPGRRGAGDPQQGRRGAGRDRRRRDAAAPAPMSDRPAATRRLRVTHACCSAPAGAGLALSAATRTWSDGRDRAAGAAAAAARRRAPARTCVPWLPALALVALAGGGALLATRGAAAAAARRAAGRGRRWRVAAGGRRSGRADVGAAGVGAGAGRRLRARRAAGRARRPGGGRVHGARVAGDGRPVRAPAGGRRPAGADAGGGQRADTRAAWDALDRGEDPTAR